MGPNLCQNIQQKIQCRNKEAEIISDREQVKPAKNTIWDEVKRIHLYSCITQPHINWNKTKYRKETDINTMDSSRRSCESMDKGQYAQLGLLKFGKKILSVKEHP